MGKNAEYAKFYCALPQQRLDQRRTLQASQASKRAAAATGAGAAGGAPAGTNPSPGTVAATDDTRYVPCPPLLHPPCASRIDGVLHTAHVAWALCVRCGVGSATTQRTLRWATSWTGGTLTYPTCPWMSTASIRWLGSTTRTQCVRLACAATPGVWLMRARGSCGVRGWSWLAWLVGLLRRRRLRRNSFATQSCPSSCTTSHLWCVAAPVLRCLAHRGTHSRAHSPTTCIPARHALPGC